MKALAAKIADRVYATAERVCAEPITRAEVTWVAGLARETVDAVAATAGIDAEALQLAVTDAIEVLVAEAADAREMEALESYYGDPLTRADGSPLEPEIVYVEIDGK